MRSLLKVFHLMCTLPPHGFPPSSRVSLFLATAIAILAPAHALEPDCTGVRPAPSGEVHAVLVADDLSLPVDATAPPGDTERLFVVEQTGQIRILQLHGDYILPAPFLDVKALVGCCSEEGLLGLAFHPRYSENRSFFIFYSRKVDGNLAVVRYQTLAGDPDRADPSSEKLILLIEHPIFGNHNGGQIAFGPRDGYLYIAVGDGGGDGTPSQDPLDLRGKLLRIDVDSGDPYAIPPTNPYAGDPEIRPEIWALGLRNPWRFTFDQATGDLYIGDVGQGLWEEVDFQPASSPGGENYNWRIEEGSHPYSPLTAYGPGPRVDPIFEYAHDSQRIVGCSVTGGVVYRGCRMPYLRGTYFFADFCANWVRSFSVADGQLVGLREWTEELNRNLAESLNNISSWGTDGLGEVYICALPSSLYRLVPQNAPTPVFLRGNANADAAFDIADAIVTLHHLFLGEPPRLDCEDAADSNDDGGIDVSDAISSLNTLFGRGSLPPLPYPACGEDPTIDTLGCGAERCI